MQDVLDGSGSEASWSLVSNDGDLIDSDDYSISEAEPTLPNNGNLNDDDNHSNVNGSDYRCLSEDSDQEHDDEDTDMTDVEEMDEYVPTSDSAPELLNSNKPSVETCAAQDADEHLYLSDSSSCNSLDFRTERRIQMFVIASVLCTLLVGALFGDLYTLQQHRCQSQESENFQEPVIQLSDQVLSFEPVFDKLSVTPKKSYDLRIEDMFNMEYKEPESNNELNQCHRDLDDALKKSTTNSVLMRYMRSRNLQLETLVQELQSFVELQRKEIESYQSVSKAPLQSESAQFDLINDLPCADDDKQAPPSDLPTNPLPEPNFLPDEEQPKPQFETCTPAERSFFNLTRSFFHKMATMANSTALTLFMEGRPELTKLSNWFQKQSLRVFPRMIEQVKTGWRSKFRSYMQKFGNALASPGITNLTKPRNFVGKIKKQIRSVFNKLTQTKWIPSDEDYCTSDGICDLLMDFGKYLADDEAFRGNLTPKQADSYVEFLKHIPARQCKDNSTLVSCERCWWVGKCDGIKKKCNLRRWQRQQRINPKAYIESSPKVKEIFKGLGWIDANELTETKMSEPVGPPRRKKMGKHEKLCHNDWLMRRGARRAEHRRRSMASDWFFERKAQRSALRRNMQASDWVFNRYGQRAALRQN